MVKGRTAVLKVNGNPVDFEAHETLAGLLERLRFVFPLVVVMVDGKVVPNGDFDSKLTEDGSTIEVIHLTSGG